MIYLGIDWAEDHHDLCLLDEAGERLATARVPDGVEGLRRLHELVALHADSADSVVVGIETDRGLLVQGLLASGYTVYAINPYAVSRYRDRHTTSGGKSDRGDAKILADLVRTDRHNHRQIAGDSDLAEAVKVLARAQQNLLWARQRHINQLRSALREFYPAMLEAFGTDLASRDALVVLSLAPTSQLGARLSRAQIRAALAQAGRQRNLDATSTAIHTALQAQQLLAPARLSAAYGLTVRASVALLRQFNVEIEQLEVELVASFEGHPDAEILCSLPGLAQSSAPGFWRSSGMTRPDIRMPDRDGATPAQRRSRAPLAPGAWCSRAARATGAWPKRATSGRSRRCARHPVRAASTTANGPMASPTIKRSARSPMPGRRSARMPQQRPALQRAGGLASTRGGCRLTA